MIRHSVFLCVYPLPYYIKQHFRITPHCFFLFLNCVLPNFVKHVCQHMQTEFACQFNQNTVEPNTTAAQTKKKAEKCELSPFPHLLTAAEYIPLCWYYYYERDRCCVVINVGPRQMRVSVVYKVWGALYVRLFLSAMFGQITTFGEKECETGWGRGQHMLLTECSCSSKSTKVRQACGTWNWGFPAECVGQHRFNENQSTVCIL